MTPLAPADIRARKRPMAVLFVFFSELAWALLIATPVHAWARHAWGAHPDGDAVLFLPGGRDLLMWLGQEDAGASVTTRTAMVLLAVSAIAMQVPLGALLASLAFSRGPKNRDADAELDVDAGRPLTTVASVRVGAGAFLPLAALLALGTIATVIVLGLGALASSAVDHGLVASLGDARSFTLRLVTFAVFAAVACVLGVFVDLARAAIGRETAESAADGTSSSGWSVMLRGVKSAMRTSRRSIGRATLGWGWRAAVGVLLVAVGYAAADALGGRGGSALLALFFVHQAIVLGRVALRASWMAQALRLTASANTSTEWPAPSSSTAQTEPSGNT